MVENPRKIHFLTFFLQNYYKNDILTTVLYTPMCVCVLIIIYYREFLGKLWFYAFMRIYE